MSKLNPQKATAYVGPGVLRKGGKITPVPNGPLIKKTGKFKGSTLKVGGVVKKAQTGVSLEERREARRVSDSIKQVKLRPFYEKRYQEEKKPGQSYDQWQSADWERAKINAKKAPEPKGERTFFSGDNGPKAPCKGGKCSGLNSSSRNGSTIKKAKAGEMIKRADGSMSKRGLWDNLRSKASQNKKTGVKPKAPTKAMLSQEKKIKAKGKK